MKSLDLIVEQEDQLHEECGAFGIFAKEPQDLARTVYFGLYALQHRGQESCGIVVNDDGLFYSYKDLGLVNEVFSEEKLSKLPQGEIAIGHVRYSTTGEPNRNNCQPIEVNHQKGRMAIAHNGNISNSAVLKNELELSGAIFHTTSDTETIAYIITKERLGCGSIEEAVSRAMDKLDGAYSLIVMSARKMICARDPHGFRPLCFGKTKDGSYVAASETCALRAVGAEYIRDVEPGEMIVFTNEGYTEYKAHCNKVEKKICVFEYIYFARPDSVVDGVSVHAARVRAGQVLAKEHPVDADIVMGVPDSGIDAALGYAQASGIPYGMGLIKNKYIGRTFIEPGNRLDKVKIKLSPIDENIRGKRIVLIDDSIVRGTTSKRLVALLKESGAKEIHMRITAPPFLHPCFYGTDIDSEENLIANKLSIPEIAERIGVDSLGYLPIEKLSCLTESESFCDACFSGAYPTEVPKETKKNRFEQKLSEKKK